MKRDDLFSHFAIKSGRHFQKSINTLNALFSTNTTQEAAYKTEKYLFHVIRSIIIFSAEEHVHITGNLYKQIVIHIIAEITFFYSFCKELLILVFILSSYHLAYISVCRRKNSSRRSIISSVCLAKSSIFVSHSL